MPRRLLILTLAGILVTTQAGLAIAQDLRVYTTVTDLSRGSGSSRPLSHNLTLFHAGKVYDFMEESGEVVIFEPNQYRFIILGKNSLATEVRFAELNQFLEAARSESLAYINKNSASSDAGAARQAACIRFQLQPSFHEAFDAAGQKLVLNGGPLNYSVKTSAAPSPQLLQEYLNFLDWAARLNYVQYPHSVFPEPRIKLNESLRHRELLPLHVELTLQADPPVHLRADHTFALEFQTADLRHITHWEQTLRSGQLHWLTFHEFQDRQFGRKSQ